MIDKNDDRLQLRLSSDFKRDIKIQALKQGYKTTSEYVFDLIRKDMKKEEV